MIRTIFFDAGNTIVYVNMDVVSGALAGRGVRLTPDELWTAEYRARVRLDQPDLIATSDDLTRWETYFRWTLEEAGVRIDVRPVLDELHEYHVSHNLWEVVPPAVPPLLKRLKERYRLAVISNSNGGVEAKLNRVGLGEYFGAVIDSAVEGVEKPDPRIFHIALERMKARPEESIHIGDFYHIDAVGALRAGLTPILLDPADLHKDKDCRRLTRLEDLESLL